MSWFSFEKKYRGLRLKTNPYWKREVDQTNGRMSSERIYLYRTRSDVDRRDIPLPQPDVDRRDGVVVRAPASQSVDQGFIPLVESYQKTLKNGIRSFPAWRSAFREGGEQAGKFACCVLGQGT